MSDTATPDARHALYAVLEDVLGHEHADTLLSYLPAHRADEAATKADLARVEARLDGRMDVLEDRFDRLEDRLGRWQRTMYVGQITALTALTALFSLINAFFG